MHPGVVLSGRFRVARSIRLGLARLELFAALLAVATGLYAGAVYLDLDLQEIGQLAMTKAGIASPQQPAGGQEPGAAGKEGPHHDAAPSAATDGRAGTRSDAANAAGRDVASTVRPPARSVAAATLAYWNRLHEVIQRERRVRHEGQQQAVRSPRVLLQSDCEAYQEAGRSIRGIASGSVDPLAVQLGVDLANWYDQGAVLAEDAIGLLEEGELVAARGPVARRWHIAQKQHANEFDLLIRKCGSVRGTLTDRHGLALTPLW